MINYDHFFSLQFCYIKENFMDFDVVIGMLLISGIDTHSSFEGLFLGRATQVQSAGVGEVPRVRSFQAFPGKFSLML